jgi:hypothetical protein
MSPNRDFINLPQLIQFSVLWHAGTNGGAKSGHIAFSSIAHRAPTFLLATFWTAGGLQVPLMIEGDFSIRIRLNARTFPTNCVPQVTALEDNLFLDGAVGIVMGHRLREPP